MNLCLQNKDVYDIHTKFTQRKKYVQNYKTKIFAVFIKMHSVIHYCCMIHMKLCKISRFKYTFFTIILYQEHNIFLYQLFINSPDRNTWCNNFKLKKHRTCGDSEWDFTFYSECHLFMSLTVWIGDWSLA